MPINKITMEISDKPANYGWKILLSMAILLLIVVFSVQNSTNTPVKLWFWEGSAPLVLLFVVCFMLGLSFTLILIWPISKHSKRKSKLIKELENRVETLEQKLTDNNKTNP